MTCDKAVQIFQCMDLPSCSQLLNRTLRAESLCAQPSNDLLPSGQRRGMMRTSTRWTSTAVEKLWRGAVPRSRSAIRVPLPGPSSTRCSLCGEPSCRHCSTHQTPTICIAAFIHSHSFGGRRAACNTAQLPSLVLVVVRDAKKKRCHQSCTHDAE